MTRFDLVIFDCDGVLVDSEPITNRVFAEMLGELGVSVTLDEMFERFVGHSMAHCLEIVREHLGREAPTAFVPEYRRRTEHALANELQRVPGIERVLDALDVPYCVASNGAEEKMRSTLSVTGLLPRFDGRLFSATQVLRGKPSPDLFLLAAREMGAKPDRVAVVEDTPVGVAAGHAAGMTVFGYAGRTPSSQLKVAGASVIFTEMHTLPGLLRAPR